MLLKIMFSGGDDSKDTFRDGFVMFYPIVTDFPIDCPLQTTTKVLKEFHCMGLTRVLLIDSKHNPSTAEIYGRGKTIYLFFIWTHNNGICIVLNVRLWIVVKCIRTQIEFLISEVLIENYAGCFETKAPLSTITTEYYEVTKIDSARECVVKCRGKSDYFGLTSVINTFIFSDA